MSYLIGFHCECGYGPFYVCDNRDAPIPIVVPPTIIDDNGEGESIGSCPRCDTELPTFEYCEHGLVRFVNAMLTSAHGSDELHEEVTEQTKAIARRLHEQIERAVDWIEAHPKATSWGRSKG